MPTLTLNPGFLPILAALLVLGAPRTLRSPIIVVSALAAFWLLLDYEFGAAAAIAQMGLPVVLLNLDELNRIFGIALLVALIVVGIYSGARRNRYEDAAMLLLAGSAVSALFVGDLVSFVAALTLSGLAAAWLVFISPIEGASRAGGRLLIWHGLEGLLFLVGVAFHLSAGAQASVVGRLDTGAIGGAFIFAALMIRIGAPMAHVWLKDAIGHASATGAGALSAFTTMMGVYALARLFPSEPLLLWIGAVMMVAGAVYAVAEDDLRRAGAYALAMQTGMCAALVGVGSPLALAAAEGHAFASILGLLALQLVLGAILERHGSARLSDLAGMGGAMPISAVLLLGCGLAVSAMPGVAMFATQAAALNATTAWDLRWLWLLIWVTPAILFISLFLRPMLAAFRPSGVRPVREAPFSQLLGVALALFLCLAVGLAPGWLFDLMSAGVAFQPFELDRVAPQFQLLGAAGVAFLVTRLVQAAPNEQPARLLDVDALYRGPLASLGRWGGVLALRAYGAWQSWSDAASRAVLRRLGQLARACDRPYADTSQAAVTLICAAAAVLLMLFVG